MKSLLVEIKIQKGLPGEKNEKSYSGISTIIFINVSKGKNFT
ncbi:hypothetical protein SAMN04487944_105127 [Gracilibacillus ureilyticus]|uniref:Uncharacterized protein n=1 Tax=Gracilibacillus ureilyticus TaxID=531814 RepID=A0A1H9PTI0_9BACI|nr:hypothetical protein SAMN04487944_105127 [Gracilibacillus ureilyticus]